MNKLSQWFLNAIALLSLPVAICRAELIVFGDSLSETGNFYSTTGGTLPPALLYFEGRFCNGTVWVEHIAKALGEPIPKPSRLGGTNYAFNGARAIGPSNYGSPSLADQVSSYLTASRGTADPEDTFLLWAGANDVFFGVSAAEANAVPNAVEAIRASIVSLYTAGARNIVVLDLPALGQTPFFSASPEKSAALDAAAGAFNTEIAVAMRELKSQTPGARIITPKISKLFQSIRRTPILYGLRNVNDAATFYEPVAGIAYAYRPGANPHKYLFWDSVHPSAKVHGIIAGYVLIDYLTECR